MVPTPRQHFCRSRSLTQVGKGLSTFWSSNDRLGRQRPHVSTPMQQESCSDLDEKWFARQETAAASGPIAVTQPAVLHTPHQLEMMARQCRVRSCGAEWSGMAMVVVRLLGLKRFWDAGPSCLLRGFHQWKFLIGHTVTRVMDSLAAPCICAQGYDADEQIQAGKDTGKGVQSSQHNRNDA